MILRVYMLSTIGPAICLAISYWNDPKWFYLDLWHLFIAQFWMGVFALNLWIDKDYKRLAGKIK